VTDVGVVFIHRSEAVDGLVHTHASGAIGDAGGHDVSAPSEGRVTGPALDRLSGTAHAPRAAISAHAAAPPQLVHAGHGGTGSGLSLKILWWVIVSVLVRITGSEQTHPAWL